MDRADRVFTRMKREGEKNTLRCRLFVIVFYLKQENAFSHYHALLFVIVIEVIAPQKTWLVSLLWFFFSKICLYLTLETICILITSNQS